MSRPPSPTRPLANVLAGEPDLARWLARAGRDARVVAIVARVLPQPLARGLRVRDSDGETLVVACSTAASVIALRRASAQALAALRTEGFEFGALKAVVVPYAERAAESAARPRGGRTIGAAGRAALASLAKRLPEGELRRAVERLASSNDPT